MRRDGVTEDTGRKPDLHERIRGRELNDFPPHS
jgi:hypothetical protein